MMEQTSADQQRAQRLQMPAMPMVPMVQQPIAQQPLIQQPVVLMEPLIPHPTYSMIPKASFSSTMQPNNKEQRMGRLIYDLDDEKIQENVNKWPISGNCVVSCSFKAIPLSCLGIHFRKLSDYGTIIEESPDKLVIRFKHRNPEMMQSLIKSAWIDKYVGLGVQCCMHCGPLLQYKTIEMMLERVVDQPFPTSESSTLKKSTLPISGASTEDKHLIGTVGEGDHEDSGGKGEVQHPDVDYDYFAEYQYQFVQLNLNLVTPMQPYQFNPTYQPQQSYGAQQNQAIHQGFQGHPAPAIHGQNHGHQEHQGRPRFPDHQLQAYYDNQRHQGLSTYNGYQESQGYRGNRVNSLQQTNRDNVSNADYSMPQNGGRFHRGNNHYPASRGRQRSRYNQRNEGHSMPRGQQVAHTNQGAASPVTVYNWQETGNNPESQVKKKNNKRMNRRGGYRGNGRGGGNVGGDETAGGAQNPPSDVGPDLPSESARGTKRPREEATEDGPAKRDKEKKVRREGTK